jgi:hypothetical protein
LLSAYTIWRGAPLTSPMKKDSRFFVGNGGKVFKRLVVMSAHVELNLLERDLLYIIWLDPGLRQYSFNALTRLKKPNLAFYKLKEYFQQGDFVDDQAVVHMALFIVHPHFRKDTRFEREIRQFIRWCMSHNSMAYTYSGFLIASKYLTPQEILSYVLAKFDIWKNDFWLGRCVAGLYPRFCSVPAAQVKFIAIIQKTDNVEAAAVLNFHRDIKSDAAALKKIYSYARSANPSYAHKLIHPKAMIILSIKQNPKSAALIKQLLKDHPILSVDPYYKAWFV